MAKISITFENNRVEKFSIDEKLAKEILSTILKSHFVSEQAKDDIIVDYDSRNVATTNKTIEEEELIINIDNTKPSGFKNLNK